jgi:hypothetical protein
MGEPFFDTTPAATMAETITHIVLFKDKPGIPWSAFENHFEAFMSLKQTSTSTKTGKPLIKSMKAGTFPLTLTHFYAAVEIPLWC